MATLSQKADSGPFLLDQDTGIDDPDKGVSVVYKAALTMWGVLAAGRSAAQTLRGCVRPTELCAAELTPTDSFMIPSTQAPHSLPKPPAPSLKARPFNKHFVTALVQLDSLSLEAPLEIVNEVLCNFMSLRFMNGGVCAGQASLCSPPWLTLPSPLTHFQPI